MGRPIGIRLVFSSGVSQRRAGVSGIRSGCRSRGDQGADRVEMRCSAPGPGRGRPGRGCRAQEDGDAEDGHPDSPAGAADQAGDDGDCQDHQNSEHGRGTSKMRGRPISGPLAAATARRAAATACPRRCEPNRTPAQSANIGQGVDGVAEVRSRPQLPAIPAECPLGTAWGQHGALMIFEKRSGTLPVWQSAWSRAEARGFEPRMGVNPNRISSAAP